jgi:hypothetical protein
MSIEEYKKKTYSNLILLDYSVFGSFDFSYGDHRLPERSEDRIKISKNIFKVMGIELGGVKAKRLSYYLKDEIAGGIENASGTGHIHFLLSRNGLEEFGVGSIIKKLKKVSRRYGRHSIKEYDYVNYCDRGIRYTLKTHKHQKLVYAGSEDYSNALRVEITRRKQLALN